MVKTVIDQHQFTAMYLSTSPIPGNREQPLSYVMRRMMVHEHFPSLFIAPLIDMARQTKWVEKVETMIRESFPLLSVHIYGSADVVDMYKNHGGRIPVSPLEGPDPTAAIANARTIMPNSVDFRKGVFYATNHRFRHVVSTVDGAILKGDMVLLGRKPHEDEWRFMGGFTEPTSETDEEDLSREAIEEFNIKVKPEDWYYLGRVAVKDWRVVGTGDAIRTGFYVAFEYEGEPVAGDDLAEVKWVNIALDARDVPLVPEHHHLWLRLQAARQSVYEHYTADKRLSEVRRMLAATAAQSVSQEQGGDDDVPF